MADEEFVYRGDLTITPLPRILATVHRYAVPGVMVVEHGGDSRRLFFLDGDIIFATSSDRGASLGRHLLEKGQITKAQFDVSCQELERSPGLRHGSVLVQMGFLTPQELGAAVRDQVQTILWTLFDWQLGQVTFRVGRFRDDEVHRINIPTPRAVLSGCKRMSDTKLVTARLGGRRTVYSRQEWPKALGGFQLEHREQALLDLVDGRRTLVELCEQGPMSPAVNARALYAMLELGLIGRVETSPGHIKIQVRSTE